MDPPEQVQRWFLFAAGRRLHLGLMGTLSFRPAAPWCKQRGLNWLALPSSFMPPFFIFFPYFTLHSDSTWDYPPIIISPCCTFHPPQLVLFILIIISLHLSVFYYSSSLSLSSSLFWFNCCVLLHLQASINNVCFMLQNRQHPNLSNYWRPLVDASTVISQWRTCGTFVSVFNLWESV